MKKIETNYITEELARETGIPVFGIEEAIRHFGVKPTKEQISALAEIPFTEEELLNCRDTHILVATFQMQLNKSWCCEGETAWRLVYKTEILGQMLKEVPPTTIWAIIGHFFATKSSTTTETLARETGIPVFGIEEAIRHFGVKPTEGRISALAEIPFTEEKLRKCKDTHILVAVLPISILEIYEKNERLFSKSNRTSYDDYERSCRPWYKDDEFANNLGKTAWHLIHKTKMPSRRRALMPTAQVIIYTIIGHFLATSERLFESDEVYTSDLDDHGYQVAVSFHKVLRIIDGNRIVYPVRSYPSGTFNGPGGPSFFDIS